MGISICHVDCYLLCVFNIFTGLAIRLVVLIRDTFNQDILPRLLLRLTDGGERSNASKTLKKITLKRIHGINLFNARKPSFLHGYNCLLFIGSLVSCVAHMGVIYMHRLVFHQSYFLIYLFYINKYHEKCNCLERSRRQAECLIFD